MIKTTLKKIRDCNPCDPSSLKFLEHTGLDIFKGDEDILVPMPENLNFDELLWALRPYSEHEHLWYEYVEWLISEYKEAVPDVLTFKKYNRGWVYVLKITDFVGNNLFLKEQKEADRTAFKDKAFNKLYGLCRSIS